MINIVIINGSPRKNGATAGLLKEMSKYLSGKEDVNISYINISDYSLLNCTGCMSCYQNGVCCLNDKVEEINALVSRAHGIIIGSPTYSSTMPGSLKTYIDRGHFVLEQSLSGKYTFALSTYEIAGGKSVISLLKTLYQYSGGIRAGEYTRKLPFNSSPLASTKKQQMFLKKTERYYRFIKNRKRKSLIDKIIHFVALRLIMKPQVLQRPAQYKAVIERWEKNGIIKI